MERSQISSGQHLLSVLRDLYESYGYTRYKMSKFEEYDLYVRNKDFLVSDSVITFTDTNGRLMALKPDVTLSIIKNGSDLPGFVQKVYYNENVYRISKGTHSFKEILQTGLECMGDIDVYCIFEVLLLACRSLKRISDRCVLDLSHLGVVSALLDDLSQPREVTDALLRCLGEKNGHALQNICCAAGVAAEKTAALTALIGLSGTPKTVLPQLEKLYPATLDQTPLKELKTLTALLESTDCADLLRLDFSVVHTMKYYNGVVFKGFVQGVPDSILSGGQYDHLMKKMHRVGGAIGFAVYHDALERFGKAEPYDADTVLLYDETTPPETLLHAIEALQKSGAQVSAQRSLPEKFRCRRCVRLKDGEVTDLG